MTAMSLRFPLPACSCCSKIIRYQSIQPRNFPVSAQPTNDAVQLSSSSVVWSKHTLKALINNNCAYKSRAASNKLPVGRSA